MVRPLRLLLLALAFILLERDILGAALQRHVDLHHSWRDPLDQVGERRRGAGERRRRVGAATGVAAAWAMFQLAPPQHRPP